MPTRACKNRRVSTFSDNTLTAFESLVLECALEDARSNTTSAQQSHFDAREMDPQDYKALCRMPGNSTCADCDARDTEWASVSFGILLCADCSGVHR